MIESGIEVQLDPGGKVGELTVWVDEKLIRKKQLIRFPDKDEILQLVKENL